MHRSQRPSNRFRSPAQPPSVPPYRRERRQSAPAAFTLVEALIALLIASVAGSALLFSTTSALQTTDETLQRAVADGLAQQLMDEVVGARYAEYSVPPQAYQTTLGPGSDERSVGTRELYDDIDDYNGLRQQPPTDRWGVALGTESADSLQRDPNFRIPAHYLDNWRQEVDVYYVDPADPSAAVSTGQPTDCRAVEVRIVHVDPDRGPRVLTKLRRVVAYVPPVQ